MNYRLQSKNPSCALIELINASIFLGNPAVSDERFEQMEKLAHCYGRGCENEDKFLDELGIIEVQPDSKISKHSLEWIKENLPVGITTTHSVFHHRSLIIEVNDNIVTVVNWYLGKNKYGIIQIDFNELLKYALSSRIENRREKNLLMFSYLLQKSNKSV